MAGQRLRDRCVFARRTDQADGYGNVQGEFAELFALWGDMAEQPGREMLEAGGVGNTRRAVLTLRYSARAAGLLPSDRVTVRGAGWNILSGPVAAGRAGSLLEFVCETGLAS